MTLNQINATYIIMNTKTDEDTLKFCQFYNLFPKEKKCSKCNVNMNLVKNAKFTLGVSWRCPRPCKNIISIRDKTFFNKTKVKISEILLFIYYWSQEVCNFKYISKELKCAEHTFVKFKSSLREVCAIYFIRNPVLFGGPGRVVQIDESLFVRRKNNSGRMPNINWVFGGIDCLSKECFLLPVAQRNACTLIPIIRTNIRPGSIIMSDLWKAYDTVSHYDYEHLKVNHKIQFINHETGANTQGIENLWMNAKRRNKKECGTKNELLESYLIEFMWRQKFKDSLFETIITHISLYYN